ncbi:MAG: hypothetical protein ACOC0D_06125 [Spirochaeta sp.]
MDFLGTIGCDPTGVSDDLPDGGDRPSGREPTQLIIEPEIVLNDSIGDKFEVSEAAVSRSSSTSTFIYGVVQAAYTGNEKYAFIKIEEARFLDSHGNVLFTDWSFFRNIESVKLTSDLYTETFVTPELPNIHYRIIEDLDDHDNVIIDDIHTIELTISVSDSDFSDTTKKLEWAGGIQTGDSTSWGLDFSRQYTNSSNVTLVPDSSTLILKDSEGRPFRWDSAYTHHVKTDSNGWITRETETIDTGETGRVSGTVWKPDYLEEDPVIDLITLEWETFDDTTTSLLSQRQSAVTYGDPDSMNQQMRNAHNAYTDALAAELDK